MKTSQNKRKVGSLPVPHYFTETQTRNLKVSSYISGQCQHKMTQAVCEFGSKHTAVFAECCVLRLPLKKGQKTKGTKSENSQQEPSTATIKTDVLLSSSAADHRTVSHGCNVSVVAVLP